MAKIVRVELTIAEAEALSDAAGNSLVTAEDAKDILLTKRKVKAALNAFEKLNAATVAAGGFKT